MHTSLAGSWKLLLLAASGAGVAGDVVHVRLEIKAQLGLERLRATRIAERHYTQDRGGRVQYGLYSVVTVVDCQRRAVHGV
eukprot:7295766-Prymnesium_polylepis.1